MNENLHKRKAELIRYLDEELAEKSLKCWQQNVNEYVLTKDMGGGKNQHPHNQEETIVKYDFKRALTSSALFLCIIPAFFLIRGDWQESGFFKPPLVMMLFVAFFTIIPLMRADKKGMLLLFNTQGFWTKSMPEMVYWDQLIVSYIRKEDLGDSTNNYLLLYYYNEEQDEFIKMECSIDGLDMSIEDIAAQLEYWKMKGMTMSDKI